VGKICCAARWEVVTAHTAVVTHIDVFHCVNYNSHDAHRQRDTLIVRAAHRADTQFFHCLQQNPKFLGSSAPTKSNNLAIFH